MAKVELTEIAGIAGGRDITRGFIPAQSLDPQDRVLLAKGGDYQTYEWVLQDDQVASCFQQRRLNVVACEWEVEPGGPRRRDRMAADSLKAQLQAVGWDRVTDKMLFGTFYGFAVAEAIYARDGAEVVLDQLKVRKQRRFRFDDQGRLRLRLPGAPYDGVPVPERKFWWYNCGADNDDEPYGLGLAHWLYWPVFFKRNGIKFWLTFLEKFGSPTVKASHPVTATDDERRQALKVALSVVSASAVAVPEGTTLELLEAARSGAADYGQLSARMDAAIAKIILSQTMTTDDGSSLAQAKVHQDVGDKVIRSDADLICDSFSRTVGTWLTEWNYPGAAVPRVWRRTQPEPDLLPQAQRDQAVYALGYRPTPEYIRATYGDGFVPREMSPDAVSRAPDAPAPSAAPDFSEPDAMASLAEQLAALADGEVAGMVAKVKAALDRVERIEDLPAALLAMYPDMDVSALAQLLGDALLVADLTGRAEVLDDAGF